MLKRQLAAGHRVDHLLIAEMVTPAARVIDIGCGDGALLQLLAECKNVDGRGVEISRERVNACVAQGLAVIQGDADRDLADYPDDAFDYAILSLTIQATRNPRAVLENLLRIGRRAIVSFPNFGHWQVRTRLLLGGRMPVTEYLPDAWYESPNAHLCTIKDFADLCAKVEAKVERAVAFNTSGQQLGTWTRLPLTLHNLLGEKAVFLLSRRSRFEFKAKDSRTVTTAIRRGAQDRKGARRGKFARPQCRHGLTDRRHQLFSGLNNNDAGKTGPEHRTGALEHWSPAHEWSAVHGGHVERCRPVQRRKEALGQKTLELGAAIGLPVTEGRCVKPSPNTAAVRRNEKQATLGRKYSPYFSQERSRAPGSLKTVHGEQTVYRVIGQRQHFALDHDRMTGPRTRPSHRTLVCRHQCTKPRCFAAKGTKIWRYEAEADNRQTIGVSPARADTVRQQPARHTAERAGIEFA
jgi:methionine biosynthesis protein MetW